MRQAFVLLASSLLAVRAAEADPASELRDWLLAHPEVKGVSVVHRREVQHPLFEYTRARVLDGKGSLVCARYRKRTTCFRHPEVTRHLWTASAVHGPKGALSLRLSLGPLPGRPQEAACYEVRFPMGTAHAARSARLPRWKEPSGPSWRAHDEPPRPGDTGRPCHPAPKSAPALPAASPPPWLERTAGLEVFLVDVGAISIAAPKDEQPCVQHAGRWLCLPPMSEERLRTAEPKLPHQDTRRKAPRPNAFRFLSAEAGGRRTLALEWQWQREMIANTVGALGSFLEVLQVDREGNVRTVGFLRTSFRRRGSMGEMEIPMSSAYLEPRLVSPTCVELVFLRRAPNPFLKEGKRCFGTGGLE